MLHVGTLLNFPKLIPLLTICRYALRKRRDYGHRVSWPYWLLRALFLFLVILYILCCIMDFATLVHSCTIILIRICFLPLVSWNPVMLLSYIASLWFIFCGVDNPTYVSIHTKTYLCLYVYDSYFLVLLFMFYTWSWGWLGWNVLHVKL